MPPCCTNATILMFLKQKPPSQQLCNPPGKRWHNDGVQICTAMRQKSHRQAESGGLEQRGEAGVLQAAREAQRQVQKRAAPRPRHITSLPHCVCRRFIRSRVIHHLQFMSGDAVSKVNRFIQRPCIRLRTNCCQSSQQHLVSRLLLLVLPTKVASFGRHRCWPPWYQHLQQQLPACGPHYNNEHPHISPRFRS